VPPARPRRRNRTQGNVAPLAGIPHSHMKADQHVLLLCDGNGVRIQHSGPCRARARGAVLIDVDTLSTLPDRELASGISEIVKYGLIRDPALFAWLEANMERLLQRDPQVPRAPQAAASQHRM